MLRPLLAGLAALIPTGPALAAILLLGVGGAGGGGGGYSGPGDVITSSLAWYGLRAYSAAKATAQFHAVNLRNTGSAETCDVNLATTGALSTTVSSCSGASTGATIATFCTGGCTVHTLYDQSGANSCSAAPCDITNATAANQPTFTAACPSLPCLTYGGGSVALASAATFAGTAQPFSLSWVGKRTGAFTANGAIFGSSSANTQTGFGNATNTAFLYAGTAAPTAAATDSALHAVQAIFNGASSILNVDNTQTAVSTGATAFTASTSVATGFTAGNAFTGTANESGIWAGGLTTPQQTSLCHNQFAYWGTATSC